MLAYSKKSRYWPYCSIVNKRTKKTGARNRSADIRESCKDENSLFYARLMSQYTEGLPISFKARIWLKLPGIDELARNRGPVLGR